MPSELCGVGLTLTRSRNDPQRSAAMSHSAAKVKSENFAIVELSRRDKHGRKQPLRRIICIIRSSSGLFSSNLGYF